MLAVHPIVTGCPRISTQLDLFPHPFLVVASPALSITILDGSSWNVIYITQSPHHRNLYSKWLSGGYDVATQVSSVTAIVHTGPQLLKAIIYTLTQK
jgi:hypothetical protein